jgi:hypothetical protein
MNELYSEGTDAMSCASDVASDSLLSLAVQVKT